MKQTDMEAYLRSAKKAAKKFGRKASAGILTAAAIGVSLPYKVEKVKDPETGDGGYVATSLFLRASVSPKCEDSVESTTRVTVRLRPMKEIGTDLRRIEERCAPKKKAPEKPTPAPAVTETLPGSPAPESDESRLSEAKAVLKEEKALFKAKKKVRKLEKRILKKRARRAKKAQRTR